MQRGKGCRCPILLHPEPAVTRRGRSQPRAHLCGLQEWVCNKQLGAPILPAEPGFDPTSPGCVSPLQLQAQKAGKKKSSHHRQWQASVSPWYPCNNLVFKAAWGFWSREREGKDRSAKEGIQRTAFSRALCPNRKARVWWFLLLRFTARSYFPWQYCPLPLWTAITKHLVSWKATGSGRSFQSAALRGANVLGGKCWGSLR